MTGSTDNSNPKSRFDNKFGKLKVKCYNCQKKKTSHYDGGCWNPTKKVEENTNFMIKTEKEVILLLVHTERIQNKNIM